MADDEHRAAVGGERVDELVDRVEVEVVRRLVEHEQLRRRVGEQQPRERDPEPLAARQRRDRPVDGIAADEEPREPVAQLGDRARRCRRRTFSSTEAASSRPSTRCGRYPTRSVCSSARTDLQDRSAVGASAGSRRSATLTGRRLLGS